MNSNSPQIILASKSEVRSNLLKGAGVEFLAHPSGVDETVVKGNTQSLSSKKLALTLAATKATKVSGLFSDALVIGADQVLECQGILFDKPNSTQEARQHLLKLRGKTHQLNSSVCVAQGGEIIWSKTDSADLTMLNFSNDFVEHYLSKTGNSILGSVGAYQLEDRGIQLFKKINGDYFTILGLPLLPLLEFLRTQNSVPR